MFINNGELVYMIIQGYHYIFSKCFKFWKQRKKVPCTSQSGVSYCNKICWQASDSSLSDSVSFHSFLISVSISIILEYLAYSWVREWKYIELCLPCLPNHPASVFQHYAYSCLWDWESVNTHHHYHHPHQSQIHHLLQTKGWEGEGKRKREG